MASEGPNRMAAMSPYLSDVGVINARGRGISDLWRSVVSTDDPAEGLSDGIYGDAPYYHADASDMSIDAGVYDNRANRLLGAAALQIADSLGTAMDKWGPSRIGVVVGSTDNGSESSYASVSHRRNHGVFPPSYDLNYQSAHSPAAYLKRALGLQGPEFSISTACSSSAVALSSARELIRGGICDAVVAGGADIVSQAVYLGFSALEAVSPTLCNPFSLHRRGITLGEGAALFLVSRERIAQESIRLLGVGETSDAHHMTAPHPDGLGAIRAMRDALMDARLKPDEIHYLNLHGTGTELNDSMESRAVHDVFPHGVKCSSTKPVVGHTLGAAGAMEAAFCWMALSSINASNRLPPHHWDAAVDPDMPKLDFVGYGGSCDRLEYAMSNSFAFGGSNLSLILGLDA